MRVSFRSAYRLKGLCNVVIHEYCTMHHATQTPLFVISSAAYIVHDFHRDKVDSPFDGHVFVGYLLLWRWPLDTLYVCLSIHIYMYVV